MTQATNYVVIIGMIVVALATGIDAALSFYIKRSAELNKPVPQQVMTIDEIAKFVVSEAATLDLSGAEKKVQAVQALLEQAEAEGKPVTDMVAKGAVQHAYDKGNATQAKDDADGEAQPLGFTQPEEDTKND